MIRVALPLLALCALACSEGGTATGGGTGGGAGDASTASYDTLRWAGSATADPLPTHGVEFCGSSEAGATVIPFGSFFNGNGNTLGTCLGEPGPMNTVNPYTFFASIGVSATSPLFAANDFESVLIYAGPWIQVVHYQSGGDQLYCDGGFSYHDRQTQTGTTSCSVHGIDVELVSAGKVRVVVPDGQHDDNVALAPMRLH